MRKSSLTQFKMSATKTSQVDTSPIRRDNFAYNRRASMIVVYIVSTNQTPIGQLNGTAGNLPVGELGSVLIFDQINDIAPSIFKKFIRGHICSD